MMEKYNFKGRLGSLLRNLHNQPADQQTFNKALPRTQHDVNKTHAGSEKSTGTYQEPKGMLPLRAATQ